MNKIVRNGFGLLAVVGIGVGLAGSSQARSVSAFAGQPQQPGAYSCFTNSYGAVTNTCSAVRSYCVALPVDSPTHAVQATVYAPDSSHTIGCHARSVTRNGGGYQWTGQTIYPSVFGSHQILALGTLGVPSAGALYACCEFDQTAKWDSVMWTN